MKIKIKAKFPKKSLVEQQLWEALKIQLISKLEGIKCEEHDEPLELVIFGSSIEHQVEVNACCQKLINEVTDRLKP